MSKRIELHIETTCSYKLRESIITPEDIIAKAINDDIEAFAIVDYCGLSSIPQILKLKKKNSLKTKFIFGISVNIKYDEEYIESVLLAKNTNGLKNLYKIVTKINEMGRYFITEEELNNYRNDLILGISKYDVDKDYTKYLDNYSYIEITKEVKEKDVNIITSQIKNKDILLIATCKPNVINESNVSKIYNDIYLDNKGIFREYLDTKAMLEKFSYLENKEDIVINNTHKIADLIEEYTLEEGLKFYITSAYSLKEDVLKRASLIYIDDIPNDVLERLNYELSIIYKYHLEGTISLLEDLIKKAKRLSTYANLSGYFSNTLVAYILGLTEVNIMELDNKRDLEADILRFGYNFRINTCNRAVTKLQDYLRRLTNQKELYYEGSYRDANNQKLKKYFSTHQVSDEDKLSIEESFSQIKMELGKSFKTYIIPSDVNILNYTPIFYNSHGKAICEFPHSFMKNHFASIFFATTHQSELLDILVNKTGVILDDISLFDKQVLKNTYTTNVSQNFVINMLSCELMIDLKNKKEPQNIYDLIVVQSMDSVNFQSNVIYYYFLAYFKTYYKEYYYEEYLNYLIKFSHIVDIFNEDNLLNIKECYYTDKMSDLINNTQDDLEKFILMLIKRLYDLKLTKVIDKVINGEVYLQEKLKNKIFSNKLTLVRVDKDNKEKKICEIINNLAIKDEYIVNFLSLNKDREYYSQKLLSEISNIDLDLIKKYYYPYDNLAKYNYKKIDVQKILKAIEEIQSSTLIIKDIKNYKNNDILNFIIDNSNCNLLMIDSLEDITNLNIKIDDLIKKLENKSYSKHIIIFVNNDNINIEKYQNIIYDI